MLHFSQCISNANLTAHTALTAKIAQPISAYPHHCIAAAFGSPNIAARGFWLNIAAQRENRRVSEESPPFLKKEKQIIPVVGLTRKLDFVVGFCAIRLRMTPTPPIF